MIIYFYSNYQVKPSLESTYLENLINLMALNFLNFFLNIHFLCKICHARQIPQDYPKLLKLREIAH